MVVRDEFAGLEWLPIRFSCLQHMLTTTMDMSLEPDCNLEIVTRATDLSNQTFPEQWDYSQGILISPLAIRKPTCGLHNCILI